MVIKYVEFDSSLLPIVLNKPFPEYIIVKQIKIPIIIPDNNTLFMLFELYTSMIVANPITSPQQNNQQTNSYNYTSLQQFIQ